MGDEINLKEFSKRFSNLVKNSSIEIPKLAEMLGIKSKSTIYRYMNGEMTPKISTIKYAAEIFNVNPKWLMGHDVPKEVDPPYKSLYDFSTENDRKTLNSAISYAIQNAIATENIPKDPVIQQYILHLEKLDKPQAIRMIQDLSEKFKGKYDFDLKEFIESLYYNVDNKSDNKIDDLYMHLAREAQELELDKEDVQRIIDLYRKFKK